tara:strand:- start:292 stop:474 length:183 start_codon:yes stop_codon:yes gene_type:complete
VKKHITYPNLIGRLRDSIKKLTSVNNVQMSTLENIMLNMDINTEKATRSIPKGIRKQGEN